MIMGHLLDKRISRTFKSGWIVILFRVITFRALRHRHNGVIKNHTPFAIFLSLKRAVIPRFQSNFLGKAIATKLIGNLNHLGRTTKIVLLLNKNELSVINIRARVSDTIGINCLFRVPEKTDYCAFLVEGC